MNIKTQTKKCYASPTLEIIPLDNQISLVLLSGDSDPGEPNNLFAMLKSETVFKNESLKF